MQNHLKKLAVSAAYLCFAQNLSQAAPIIIDHTAVAKFSLLSQADIDCVKTMWISMLGQSHSYGYRVGCQLVQNQDSRFAVSISESGPPEPFTTNHLRISRTFRNNYENWDIYGDESTWYTSTSAIATIKRDLSYCSTNVQRAVLGLAWSWQFSWHNAPASGTNPVFNCQWAGSSVGGPDGDLRWGLTADDYPRTGNRVCMDTYLNATAEYRNYCKSNAIPTAVIFTTAPPDYGDGNMRYQAFIKNNHIRSYVLNTTDAVLFDFADILCWDDSGNRATNAWTDLAGSQAMYELIAEDNYLNLDGNFGGGNPYHIGERGALRLGKALWVMLAQIAEQHAAPPRPILQVVNSTPGVIQVQFMATSNVTYYVQSSPTWWAPDSWQNLVNIASQPYERTIFFVDHPPSTNRQGFYRVFAQPFP